MGRIPRTRKAPGAATKSPTVHAMGVGQRQRERREALGKNAVGGGRNSGHTPA